MSLESELGPLWETQPKIRGFRLAILTPCDLHHWAVRKAIEHGDLPKINLTGGLDFLKFLTHESNKLNERERGFGTKIFPIICLKA